ncbi:MAG: sensor histidine kinase [Candidatus Promineifilaceae bacterium]
MTQPLGIITPTRLQRLLEISTTLSSTLDLKQLMEMVISAATDLTNTEVASIILLDRVSGELYFAAASGENPPEQGMVVPLEGSIAGWVVRSGEPIVIDDVQTDARYYERVERSTHFVTRNMVAVPLINKGEVVGVLEAINKGGRVAYSDQDLAILQALASQAAVAIENARLFQQTDLIAEFMHEVKTPLSGLTAAAEMLGRQPPPEKQAELVEILQIEIGRLARLAQDFLDLARLESGRSHINREPVDLAELVREVVALQAPQAAARKVKVATRIADDLPDIRGDHDRLKQVFLNLTSNAIKYNVEGGKIEVCLQSQNGSLLVEISDTGRGIAAEYLPHLFDRFYRVPDGEGFSEGSGLGLAIARRILEEHGGRIEVRSQAGQGTTVACTLPL